MRSGIRAFGHSPFVAARLPAPTAVGPAAPSSPVGTRRRSATECAAAMRSGIRPYRRKTTGRDARGTLALRAGHSRRASTAFLFCFDPAPGRPLSGPSLRSGLCLSAPFCFQLSVLSFPNSTFKIHHSTLGRAATPPCLRGSVRDLSRLRNADFGMRIKVTGGPGGRARPGEDHRQGCRWHIGAGRGGLSLVARRGSCRSRWCRAAWDRSW